VSSFCGSFKKPQNVINTYIEVIARNSRVFKETNLKLLMELLAFKVPRRVFAIKGEEKK